MIATARRSASGEPTLVPPNFNTLIGMSVSPTDFLGQGL
jgi:hypothetical protein